MVPAVMVMFTTFYFFFLDGIIEDGHQWLLHDFVLVVENVKRMMIDDTTGSTITVRLLSLPGTSSMVVKIHPEVPVVTVAFD